MKWLIADCGTRVQLDMLVAIKYCVDEDEGEWVCGYIDGTINGYQFSCSHDWFEAMLNAHGVVWEPGAELGDE